MKRFRALIFWCHLATGFLAGLVVLIMSVTGVLLTYQKQITRWADMRAFRTEAPAPGAAHLPLETLMAQVSAREPKPPTAVTWYADPAAPAMVAFGRERTVFVNRYTGATLGDGSGGVRTFFRVVTDWHRWLGASGESRDTGKAVTGAANLGFLFLVVSGFYLWWPRSWNRRALRNVTWFRGGLPAKARDFNWHNVIGLWSVAPLFLIVLSGVVISYSWAGDLVYRVVGEAPPAPGGGGGGAPAGGGAAGGGATAAREGARPGGTEAGRPGGEAGRPAGEAGGRPGGEGRGESGGRSEPVSLAGLDRAAALAARQVEGWRSISLQVPKEADAPLALTIDRGSGGQPQKRGQLKVDRVSGQVVSWEPFSSNTPGRRLRMFLRFAHTGEVGGIVGQTIAGLVSLGAVVLVWTGIALSLRRFGAWRGRRGPDGAVRRQRGRGAEQTAGVS